MKLYLIILFAFSALMAIASMFQALVNESSSPGNNPDGPSPVPLITAKLVEQLAYAGGTDSEIADRFRVDVAFLRRRYSGVLRVARALRRLTLRGLQFDLARKLNAPMLTWLGRNELGQTNNPPPPGESMPEITEE